VGHALLLEEMFGGYCARGGEVLHAMENLRTRREPVHTNRCTRRRTRTPQGFPCTLLQMKIQPTLRTGVTAMSSVAFALLQW